MIRITVTANVQVIARRSIKFWKHLFITHSLHLSRIFTLIANHAQASRGSFRFSSTLSSVRLRFWRSNSQLTIHEQILDKIHHFLNLQMLLTKWTSAFRLLDASLPNQLTVVRMQIGMPTSVH